jgi:hypothetical protein
MKLCRREPLFYYHHLSAVARIDNQDLGEHSSAGFGH